MTRTTSTLPKQPSPHDPNSNISSPQKAGAFTGDEFSDESELTDEDEDQNDDADASSLSDDDLGGSEDDEDEDDDDSHSKTHEDEAAEALAALTGGAEGADDDANAAAAAGLDALAALATAGVNGDAAANAEDEDEDDEEDEEEDASDADADADDAAAEAGTSHDGIVKHGRLHQLQQQADADDLSSDITPEPEDDIDADGHAGAEEGSDHEHAGSPRTTDLDLIASMKKRAAATGGATQPARTRAARDAEADADVKAADADHADADQLDTAAGTPAPDAVEPDEDASTDEAAIRRQEAMEALTKIEIGFAMLRDRLYVERLQEISKEGEMIPQAQEARPREAHARLRRVPHEGIRSSRPSSFATPDRLHIPLALGGSQTPPDRANPNASRADRQQSAKRKAVAREIEPGDEFVAYPDLKGLAEVDVMMDIEQMGIRPAGVPPGMYDPFYGAPVGLEFQNPDVYAMYGPEAAAAAAAARTGADERLPLRSATRCPRHAWPAPRHGYGPGHTTSSWHAPAATTSRTHASGHGDGHDGV
ncbi:hypothetical protein L1887_58265 [Cichorium endivia]|nr:hypothetical protein L1887_58265 [Cichorium endivia]